MVEAVEEATEAVKQAWRYVRPSELLPPDRGDRIADAVAGALGSWRYILIQTVVVVAWIALNLIALLRHWDPYPFVLLNLFFSTQASYAAPLILMAENRAAEVDRARAENAYEQTAETHALAQDIDRMQRQQMAMLHRFDQVLAELRELRQDSARHTQADADSARPAQARADV